jgi:calpain-15
LKAWENVRFARVSDVYGSETNFTLFYQLNDSNEFVHGSLLDSYFLAALTAMLEYPQRVIDLFVSGRKNKYGCYAIKLYLNGERKEVVVDDMIPYDDSPEVDNWAFARNKNVNEIYVLLLEKALAKVFGSYEAIESSKPNQALLMLSGFPCDVLINRK